MYDELEKWTIANVLERIKLVGESCTSDIQRNVAYNYADRLISVFCTINNCSIKSTIDLYDFAYHNCYMGIHAHE